MAKKRKSPRKRATTEAQVRAMIARHERLAAEWLTKLTAATTQVRKHTRKAAYYNQRLAAMADKREASGSRSININDLED